MTLKESLKARSMKLTPQRAAVYEALSELGHADAGRILAYVREHGTAHLTEASAYNTLSLLVELGLCVKSPNPGGNMVFDINTAPHMHIYDRIDGTLKDLPDDGTLEQLTSVLRKNKYTGYKMESVQVLLVCKPRRRKKSSRKL